MLRLQAELERDFPRLKGLEAHARIDVLLQNGIRIFGGDLLDVHSPRGRCHEHRFAFGPVHQNAKVKFLLDGQRLFNEQPPHDATLRSGLMRYQLHAQHLGRKFAGFVHRLGNFHAAAFTAASGVNLRFDHNSARPGVE